jgi:hypothetical protein
MADRVLAETVQGDPELTERADVGGVSVDHRG